MATRTVGSIWESLLLKAAELFGTGVGSTIKLFLDATGSIAEVVTRAFAYPFTGQFLILLATDVVEKGSPKLFPVLARAAQNQTGSPGIAQFVQQNPDIFNSDALTQAIGQFYFDELLGAFQQDGPVTPQAAQEAAQRLIGINLLFQTKSWVQAVVDDVVGLHTLDKVGELGERVERALGLGRLIAIALRPALSSIISDPLEIGMNRKYTPNKLSMTLIQDIAARGYEKPAWFLDRMLDLGFDQDHAFLIWQTRGKKFSETRLKQMYERGIIDDSQLEIGLKRLEYADEDIELVKDFIINERAFDFSEDIAKEALNLFSNGQLDESKARAYLREVNWSSEEISLAIELGELRKLRTDLSPSQILNLMGDALMTQSQALTRLRAKGYDMSDAQMLIQQELLSRKAKPPKVTPAKEVTLTQAQVLTAYRQGVISEAEARERLRDLGLDSADIAILIELNTPLTS